MRGASLGGLEGLLANWTVQRGLELSPHRQAACSHGPSRASEATVSRLRQQPCHF